MDALKQWGVYYLSNRTVNPRDAVMFDIDDTLIFTDGQPNQPIIDLVHISKELGYEVVIITARPQVKHAIDWTIDQMERYGIDYDHIGFTSAETKSLMKRGLPHRFILSIGDMHTDLTDSDHWLNISNFDHS